MSATAVESVINAALRCLREPTALAGGHVYEDADVVELPETVAQAVVIDLDSATPTQIAIGSDVPLQWRTVLRVECFSRRNARGAAGMPSASALHAQAHARLVADQTLGGVASGVELLRINPARDLAATRAGVLVAFYLVLHRSTHDTLLPAA